MFYQTALLLVIGVVPTLQIVRKGVNEDIAFILAGFNIILSDDRKEVVKIVVYYMWCVEGEFRMIQNLLRNQKKNNIY